MILNLSLHQNNSKMANSNQSLSKYSGRIYQVILGTLLVFILLGFIPGLEYLSSWLTPPVALFIGLAYALLFGQPYAKFNSKVSKKLLHYSIIGLGFGMNLHESIASGKDGMMFTIVSVAGTLIIGMLIGYRFLKIDKNTSYLISSGTAICGGSAIAAVGGVIDAKDEQMSVSLGTVFILNAVALFAFPVIGHYLGLDQHQFGTWAAIAIHDTSSVVGAGEAYGEEALKIATTIKLTRALWIVPVAIITSFIFKSKGKKVSVPMFIVLFVVAMLINTYFLGDFPQIGSTLNVIARKALTITLFFIGASLSRQVLRNVGLRPMIQGISLWIFISVISLVYILMF